MFEVSREKIVEVSLYLSFLTIVFFAFFFLLPIFFWVAKSSEIVQWYQMKRFVHAAQQKNDLFCFRVLRSENVENHERI